MGLSKRLIYDEYDDEDRDYDYDECPHDLIVGDNYGDVCAICGKVLFDVNDYFRK